MATRPTFEPARQTNLGYACGLRYDLAMRTLARRVFAPVLLAGAFLLAARPSAHAQSARGFALDRYQPSERGSDWFVGESLDLRGRLRPAVGVVMDESYRSLVVYDEGRTRAETVRHMLLGHVGASLVIASRVRVALSLPVQLFADGDTAAVGETTYEAPRRAQGLGDLRVGADARVFGNHGDVVTGAVGVQLWTPTGSPVQYTSDGEVRLRGRAMIAGDVARVFTYAAQLGVGWRARSEHVAGGAIGSELGFALSAGARLADRRLIVGPEVFGTTALSDPFSRLSTPLEALLGAHYGLRDVRLGAGVGTALTRGQGAPALRALLSVEWVPSPPPPAPRSAAEPPSPPAPPSVPLDPAPRSEVYDGDGDGVPDLDDACPTRPGLREADPSMLGCPDPDRDHDGVLDVDDACPDAAGPAHVDPTRSGCPGAFLRGERIQTLDTVTFAPGSAAIVPGSSAETVLTNVLEILREHPEIRALRVEGHTDDRGSAELNRSLSIARAAAIVRWFTARGIASERLTSNGFGPDRPIDSNETEGGRRKNRRVEFHVVTPAGGDSAP